MVSLAARRAVLTAADLLEERGLAGFTVDEVARQSGVSKTTTYKHRCGGYDLAVGGDGDRVTDAVPVIATGDAVHDLRDQIERLAAFYARPRVGSLLQRLAVGIGQPSGPTLVRDRFFARRRAATVALITQGQASGQLRADVDAELAIDVLYGGIVFRFFNGVQPFDADGAAALARVALVPDHDELVSVSTGRCTTGPAGSICAPPNARRPW